ncbi:hypothetical protein PUR71_07005 [Streptomyces sp. SP17BM10]|uniref:hypothetical protein n=1 Tax=Streptomyces sp. SP17BM10 TaxID=3002530 RepID=UPI002E7A0718|nr:hypothetical protein [Streptomyces sp. SP17BM10]MEE1782671.1 hypothetical protein [Streptomyces sp. SP17BM10]
MDDDQDFDALLERSSLGSPGARRLRASTSASRAAAVRRIVELRSILTHADDTAAKQAMAELSEALHGIGHSTPEAALRRAHELLHDWGISFPKPDDPATTSPEPPQFDRVSLETDNEETMRHLQRHLGDYGIPSRLTPPPGNDEWPTLVLTVRVAPHQVARLTAVVSFYLSERPDVRITIRTPDGRAIEMASNRLLNMDRPILAALEGLPRAERD